MSQFRSFRPSLQTLLITGCAMLPILASQATAAPLRSPIKKETTYSTSLQSATQERAVRTLDWRTPSLDLRFNLSRTDTIRDLNVTLSADPLPGVDPSLPLMVQFNNGKPVPLKTQGRGFDATVALDPSRARASGNVLRLSHAVPCNSREGGYAISLDDSRLTLTARAKNRRLQLREVESRLSASAFAPSTVGLIADGPLATQLQALGAQAIGLRMEDIPDFRTTVRGTEFDLVMVRRDQLHRYTNEADILAGTGPKVELSRAHSDRLFLTGDTDAEVLQTVQAFATNFLPRSRRSTTSPGEIGVQSPLDYARTTVTNSTRLDALTVTTGALREYTFDVPDPSAMSGDLVLRLTRDSRTAPGARLKAVLNGESLGEARLDGRRKTVSYPIRKGQLRGSENQLELTTIGADDQDACSGIEPFIAIGAGSKLRLDTPRPSAPTDLSRLAADGSIFGADAGRNAQIVLPKQASDFNAALRVVARLGEATGRGWTQAEFRRGTPDQTDRHVLLIEPFTDIEAALKDKAPRGLQSAWRGTPTDGENRLVSAERYAALDADEAVRMASRRLRASGRINAGGVAAIYPAAKGQLVGIISNTPGQAFATSIRPLADDAHWNGMSGGVTRWNNRAIVMAQAALPAPGIAAAPVRSNDPSLWTRLVELDVDTIFDRDWSMPELSLPQISLPSIDAETIKARFRKEDSAWVAPATGADIPAIPDIAAPVTETLTPTAPIAVTPPVRVVEVAPATSADVATTQTQPMTAAATNTVPPLRGSIDLRQARHDATAKSKGFARWFKSSWAEKRRSFKAGLRSLEIRSNQARADLRQTTGLRAPNVSGLRIGGYEIPPAILALILASILTVIGLFFVTTKGRGASHH